MAVSFTALVTIVYVSLNVLTTLVVSIVGVKYAKEQFKKLKEKRSNYSKPQNEENESSKKETNDQRDKDSKAAIDETANEPPKSEETTTMERNVDDEQKREYKAVTIDLEKEEKDDEDIKEEQADGRAGIIKSEHGFEQKVKQLNALSFFKLWAKLSWKMRSVYMSLFVHAFDVLTDILVIISWWDYEKDGNVENINARLMAICAIIVLAFHKIVSTAAFWIKEQNFNRCLLQFFDFLIFEEIYISHKQIVSQFKGTKSSEAEAVDTSTSFKYIRSLEAVFESIPQSVLQMVFIIRTGGLEYNPQNFDLFIISYLSIFQSIVSMTNSIIKNDNLYMNFPRFKKHKQRLPPTLPFLKHMICRLSEIFYRIVLLSLFWSVCGGLAFGILLAVELTIVIVLTLIEKNAGGFGVEELTFDECLLRFQALVILPSEMVYAAAAGEDNGRRQSGPGNTSYDKALGFAGCVCGICPTLCCFYFPAILLSTGCRLRNNHFIHPTLRIGVSMSEWTIIIFFHAFDVYSIENFLLQEDRGLFLFIIGIVCFLIYSQYLSLLPDFALPLSVSIRSKWGYAFNGELEELKRMYLAGYAQRINVECTSERGSDVRALEVNEIFVGLKKILKDEYGIEEGIREGSGYLAWKSKAIKKAESDKLKQRIVQDFDTSEMEIDFVISDGIDTNRNHRVGATLAAFAYANDHMDIVRWLEDDMGAIKHINVFNERKNKDLKTKKEFFRNLIGFDKN